MRTPGRVDAAKILAGPVIAFADVCRYALAMVNTDIVFVLEGVQKSRVSGPGYALDIPCLTVRRGEAVAITGPSGSGKSTALDILGMALQPDAAGRFTLHTGDTVTDVAACWRGGDQNTLAALRLRHMGYVLQTGGLLPFLSARGNMELTAMLNGRADARARVEALAERLGIARLLDSMPGRLSIGERQRVAIGRALASGPDVILADEPTAALDPYHAGAVLDMFLEAARDMGVTLIMVTHDQDIVRERGLKEWRIRVTPEADGLSRAVLEA